ncbi:MAG: PadR family transcriptional regulator [Hyphomonadaceae bacterium]
MEDILQDWEKRWRKSVLPFAALAALREGPKHGYALATSLRDLLGAAAPEGTLYPLLNGFERDGLTKAEWAIQETGPARKTYALTPKGHAVFDAAVKSWGAFSNSLGGLLT